MALLKKDINKRYRDRHPGRSARSWKKWRNNLSPEEELQYKENARIRAAVYAASHRQQARDRAKIRYRTHPPEPEAHRTYMRTYHRTRRSCDIAFRLLCAMRHRIWLALKGGAKSQTTMLLVGCDMPSLKAHLESFFQSGMSWGNYGNRRGNWSVDHIRPCASFNLLEPEQQRQCFHYTNLQPMWHIDNILKRDHIPPKG
jgi:hypothetical protein